MALEVITATAPSAWACYLINGDASGLDAADVKACDAWIAREGLGTPVSCDDAGFLHWHDARPECPLAADCQTYAFLIDARARAAQ